MNKTGEAERRLNNLKSLFDEFEFHVDIFYETQNKHHFERGAKALNRYKWLLTNPEAVKSK